MIPDLKLEADNKIAKTVRVMKVKGGGKEQTFFRPPSVTNKRFQNALISTLKESHVFESIQTEGNPDFDLRVNILSQNFTRESGTVGVRHEMIVSYNFLLRGTDNVIWRGTYSSDFGSPVLGGGRELIRAVEGNARENLKLLIKDIIERWPEEYQ